MLACITAPGLCVQSVGPWLRPGEEPGGRERERERLRAVCQTLGIYTCVHCGGQFVRRPQSERTEGGPCMNSPEGLACEIVTEKDREKGRGSGLTWHREKSKLPDGLFFVLQKPPEGGWGSPVEQQQRRWWWCHSVSAISYRGAIQGNLPKGRGGRFCLLASDHDFD